MTAEAGEQSQLDQALLAAHARDDRAALVTLYQRAADHADTPNAESFFLVQAYIFALETAHPAAPALHQRLIALGREE